MTSIALTLATRASLESLRLTTAAAEETTIRLGTGRKVNTALDGPGAFFTARSLSARANELDNLQYGFANAIKALEADAHAIKSTQKLLDQLQSVADEARRNRAEQDEVSKAILNHSFGAVTDSIQTVPALTGKKPYLNVWAGGQTPALHTFSTDGQTVQDLINTINGAANGVTASFNTTTGQIELDGAGKLPMTLGGFEGSSGLDVNIYQHNAAITTLATAESVAADGTKLLGGYTTTAIDFPFGGGANAQNGRLRPFLGPEGDAFVDSLGDPNPNGPQVNRMVFVIEGQINIPAGGATAFEAFSDDGFEMRIDGAVVVDRTTNTAPAFFTQPVAITEGLHDFRLIWWENGGQEALFGQLRDAGGNVIPIGGNLIPSVAAVEPETEYYQQAIALKEQITDLVDDSGYLGRTLGRTDPLTVGLNERGTEMKIELSDIGAQGLGLETLSQIDWLSNFDKVDDTIKAARAKLEAHAARTATALASLEIRRNFNDALIATLRGGSDNLILADANEEGANLLASQTRIQLSNAALGLATQADQSALGLFR